MVGAAAGNLRYFSREGDQFTEKTGSNNPFDGVTVSSRSAPEFVDLDGDGQIDTAVGDGDGVLSFFRNDGSNGFTQQTGSDNPFAGIDVGTNSTPTFADIDRDGDLDAFVGDLYGRKVHYFENTGNAKEPQFEERLGADNPFDGSSTWGNAPTLGDLDGDGDLDAFIGRADGFVTYLANAPAKLATFHVIPCGNEFFELQAYNSNTNDSNPTNSHHTIAVEGDILNAAAVTSDLRLDLTPGSESSLIAGRQLSLSADTLIKTAFGGDGNDLIIGNTANNVLEGGRGHDVLKGRLGADRLLGGKGADQLLGGRGKDTLTGGAGQDTFIYRKVRDFGDTITDFEIGIDKLDLSALFKGEGDGVEDILEDFGDYVKFQQLGANTKVRVNSQGDDDGKFKTLATLINVDKTALSADHFVIV